MGYEDRPIIILQNILKHVPDSMCTNVHHILHPHHCEHLKFCTKKYSEPLNFGWNTTLGELNYGKSSISEYWIAHYFSASCVHFFAYSASLSLKKQGNYMTYILNGYRYYQYKYVGYSQAHIWISKF